MNDFSKAVDQKLFASDEDGNIYQFDLNSGRLLDTKNVHSQTISGFVFTTPNSVLTISLDGYLRISSLMVSLTLLLFVKSLRLLHLFSI